MDINRARQQLLNRFPQRYRQHIIDFAKNLSLLNADVIIFTARKAACFFHCLEHLRLWTAGPRIITTDRLLDHDSGWLRGKRVVVVDEVIVSGTSLCRLKAALLAAGAVEVTIHALFINKDWFVREFFTDGSLANSYIELPGTDAQALGTTIVRAFQSLPRPYSIDYPMSGWVTLTAHDAETLTCLPGWIFSTVDEQWGQHDQNVDSEELEFFRFEPSYELKLEICKRAGIPASDVVLLKIRTYGRWEQANEVKTYHFRIVPYVILEEQDELAIDEFFNDLISNLDDRGRTELANSCVTGKARLRVIQYVIAARLARIWSHHCQEIGLRIPFVEDQRELSFVFPASVTPRLASLCSVRLADHTSAQLNDIGLTNTTPEELEELSDALSASQYLALSNIFLDLYLNEEIPERIRAKEEGLEYFVNLDASGRGNRLARGKTLPEVRDLMVASGINVTPNQLSIFVDLAVDSGVIVPITAMREVNGARSTLTRAYRHGEETYITQRDLGLFHIMLRTMAEDVSRIFDDKGVRTRSFNKDRMGRILTEKALVLFVRYAIDQGIFPRVYANDEDRSPETQLMGIGYDMFGARVAIGEHKPTQVIAHNTFVNWLLKTRILTQDAEGGYAVNAEWNNPYGAPDSSHVTNATRFASVMSSAIQCLVERVQGRTTGNKGVMKTIDRTFVTLTTCESEASTLMAIGAELRRFDRELLSLGVTGGATLDIRTLVTANRFVRAVIHAMNSGYLKLSAFVRSEAQSNASELSNEMLKHDRVYAGLWDDIWQAVRREQSGQARDVLLQHLSGAVSVLLKGLLLVHFVREVGLVHGGASERKIKAASRALKAKLRQVNKLAGVAKQSTDSPSDDLGLAISEAVDWFERLARAAPQNLPAFSAWAVTELSTLRVRARDQFEWIDGVTSDDGRIARLKEYDSILSIRTDLTFEVWQQQYSQEFDALLSAAVTRFHRSTAGPRAYSQAARESAPDQGHFHAYGARQIGGKMVITFLADGMRGSTWLGYMQASVIKLLTKSDRREPLYLSSVALLGLEDSRRIYRDFDNGAFVSPTTAKALVRAGHKSNEGAESVCAIVVDGAGRNNYGATFIKETNETLRRKIHQVDAQEIVVPEAGGTFTVENYSDGDSFVSMLPTTDVAWVLIVEDELSAVLKCLEENEVEVLTNMRNDGIIVGDAVIPHDRGLTATRIFISLGQGNAAIGNLLSNICATESKAFKFIVVSGICCSFTEPESLTKVVVPTSSLDMQTWRKTDSGRTPRSQGIKLPIGSVQLIRWYLARRDASDTESVSIIDNAVMISDNDLLRVDSPNEEHRMLAKQYSDKAVAYDMETAGVADWGYQNPQFPSAVVIKGLSDFGKSDKADDDNRFKAATNAIAVSLDFIRVSSAHDITSDGHSGPN